MEVGSGVISGANVGHGCVGGPVKFGDFSSNCEIYSSKAVRICIFDHF